MTLLFRDSDKRIELRSSREGPVAFRQPSEAAHYLRRSTNRPAVTAVLRKVLSEHHHVQVWRLSDDAVIDEVARRLVNGSLQLLEMLEPEAASRSERRAPAAKQTNEAIKITHPPRAGADARVEAGRRSLGTSAEGYNGAPMSLLFRHFDKRVGIRSTRDGRIRYRRHDDAVHYLGENRGEPGLIDALREALAEHTRIDAGRLSDKDVIEEVERRLLNGSLQLMEMFAPRIKGQTTLAKKAEEEPAAVSAAAVLAAATQVAEAPPLLPLLEQAQIEGAEVLPEIMQTLEQIDLTMAKIDLANVSLEPTPSGVPAIDSAMQQASSSVTTSLDEM
jgi:hypothetical protein